LSNRASSVKAAEAEVGAVSEVAVAVVAAAGQRVAVGEAVAAAAAVVEGAVGAVVETIVGASGGTKKRMTGVLVYHEVRQVRSEKAVVKRLLRRVRFGRLVVRGGADGMLVRMRCSINGTTAVAAVGRHATNALP
jgi:hypothetical protein